MGLQAMVDEKQSEIKGMMNRVKEAEQAMEAEKQRCKDRVRQVEEDFGIKEKTL